MLERFESIKKVGLFEDYIYSPGCDFAGITLIYGDNGVGKSTLAAILDSLRERNSRELIRRRSLPGNVNPVVSVRLDEQTYAFNGNDWDKQPPFDTIDVFYPVFVSRNVHSTTSVDPDQRRNLCELMLGRQAIEKLVRLTEADREARQALDDKKDVDKKIQLLLSAPDTIETFIALPRNPGIDEEIERVRAELKRAQRKDIILSRPLPEAVNLPRLDRDVVKALLERSSASLGSEICDIVQEHIRVHLDNKGENWLGYGAEHIGLDNKCPFCARDLSGSNLATAIRSYFSEEYKAYTELLSKGLGELWNGCNSDFFALLRGAFSSQITKSAQWAGEDPIDLPAIEDILKEAERLWNSAAQKLKKIIDRKQAKPLEKIEPIEANEALADNTQAIILLDRINDALAGLIKRGEEVKLSLSRADIKEIENRLHYNENQKKRYEPLAMTLAEKRDALVKKRSDLEAEKIRLKNEIDEHASKVIGKYQAGINYYLEYFGCDIRIESFEPKFPSGRASVQYSLKAHGHEFELGISINEPSFETVLSEGDKNTLALSFFFSRLRDYDDLSGRIIVLDDPVNSLGGSRRRLIEEVICDLRLRGAQVVLMTHDERLAAMVWTDKKLNEKDTASFQVEKTSHGSHLAPWNVEQATQSEYVKNFLILQDYVDNGGDHEKAAKSIRPYLEQRLIHLCPGPPLDSRDSLGKMIKKIRESQPRFRLCKLKTKLTVLESINNASIPSHHAADNVPSMPPLTPEEVRIYTEKALDVL